MQINAQRGMAPGVAIVLALVIIIGGGLAIKKYTTGVKSSDAFKSKGAAMLDETDVGNEAAAVVYGATGFSPEIITVRVGDIVTWTKEGGPDMWVGTDEHPTHAEYDGTTLKEHCATKPSASFDQCGIGNIYSFTFTKPGTFSYHNHRKALDSGTIIVTP
jgi:plastocyanin